MDQNEKPDTQPTEPSAPSTPTEPSTPVGHPVGAHTTTDLPTDDDDTDDERQPA